MIMLSDHCTNNFNKNNMSLSSTNNLNKNNMSLNPGDQHHHQQHDDNNCHERHLPEEISNPQQTSYQTRPAQRPRLPPHITICPPDEQGVIESHFLEDDEIDNDVFQSPTTGTSSETSSYSDDKHKVHSGRLYLICHTGNAYILSSPTRSPTSSPTQSLATFFPFQATPPPCTQQCHSPSFSPCSSPTPSSTPKVSVFVRVYRCNTEHFAVITRDSLFTSKPVYLNMRHSRVIPGDCLGRFIVTGKCDSGSIIEFEVPELSSLTQWLDAFQVYTPAVSPNRSSSSSGSAGGASSNSSPAPRSPVLPTLAETDEDD